MPATQAARLDEIERLGFEQPQARCHEEIRYWSFLAALHSLPVTPGKGSF
jgi:hypothetical protein